MTPNQQTNATSMGTKLGALGAAKASSTICLLAGIWFFVSPWIYGAFTIGSACNCWIVGGFMILFAIIRIARPAYSTIFSWVNTILGIWAFCSPWIYGYTDTTGRFINSLCVGVIVFLFSLISARISGPRNVSTARP